jgi:hypothetical protein
MSRLNTQNDNLWRLNVIKFVLEQNVDGGRKLLMSIPEFQM